MDDASRFQRNFAGIISDLFRLAQRDHGLTYTRLAALADLPAATVGGWARGEAAMPAWAFFRLAAHLPDDLLTLAAETAGKMIVTADGTYDLDAVGREAAGFTARYVDAKSDGVISPNERHALHQGRRKLAVVAAAASAA